MRRTRSIGSGSNSGFDTATRASPPVSKRQRLMMDQFETMSLNHNTEKMDPFNTANHERSSWTVTETMSDDDDDAMSNSEEQLTAEQEAQRKIVYQLALGKAPKETAPKNIVDEKLEEMIRRSRLQLQSQKAKDDFHVQTPYSHSSFTMKPDSISASGRQRSNSLPQEWNGSEQVDTAMDVNMMI